MKKFIYGLSVILSVALVAACQEELDEPAAEAPVILVAESEINVPAEGATQRLAFQIENPVEGVQLSVSADDSWVEDISVTSRTISFVVGKNETDAFRSTDLHLTYEGADTVSICVSQEQWTAPITLTVHEIDATSVKFSVNTASEDITWIGQIVGKEWYESYEGDQAIFEADLAYFSSEASSREITLKEYISGIVNKGTKENLVYTRLDPLADYVLYVYGMSLEGDRTTALYTAAIKTGEPYAGPITFEFDIKETDAVMDVTVTPSHDGVDYYWNMTTPEALAEYKGATVQESIAEWLKAELKEVDEYDDYADRAEYFEYNTTKNQANSIFEGIVYTDYIFFAFKWNQDCEIVGDIAYVEYSTGGVKPSDNKIEVTVSDITQSSFHVEAVTTNSDPYFLIAEPVSEMTGVDLTDDDAVFHYFYDWLGTFHIWNYVNNGNMGGNFKELKPDTEYNLVTFGYISGALTTSVQIQKVRTLASGDPKDCKFGFEVSNIKTTSAEASVIPSDKGHYYYWDIYPAETTANMVKQQITKKFNDEYYGDMWEFMSELTISDDTGYLSYLLPDTAYKLAAVIIDHESEELEFLSYVVFSDEFTTPEAKISTTTVTCGYHEYYDGDEIAELEPNKFGGLAGYPIIPLKIDIVGDYAEYYYSIYDYIDGLDDPAKYPDSMLYNQLFDVGWSLSRSQYFRGKWNTPLMIAAMAIDLDGNYTEIYRQKFTLTKSGAAPAINYISSYGKTETRAVKSSVQSSEPAAALRPGRPLKRSVRKSR